MSYTVLVRVVAGSIAAVLPAGCSTPGRALAPIDERIDLHEQAIAIDPERADLNAGLAAAFLERARLTWDPEDVRRARAAGERSIEIESGFDALCTMASISIFSHRFEDGLRWAGSAGEAEPMETAVTLLAVDSHLGLGRNDEAAALLPPLGKVAPDFNLSMARGRWLAAEGRTDEAVEAYLMAAEDAAARRATDHAGWARVNAAGVLLDAGRLGDAREQLGRAAAMDPDERQLRMNEAALLEAEGRPAEALEIYDDLIRDASDPTVHAAAYVAARDAGDLAAATRHFDAASAGFRKAIDAGEAYTLGALALLQLTARTNLDEARELARRNLEHTRTARAYAVMAALEE